jgi:hypothetical protein
VHNKEILECIRWDLSLISCNIHQWNDRLHKLQLVTEILFNFRRISYYCKVRSYKLKSANSLGAVLSDTVQIIFVTVVSST